MRTILFFDLPTLTQENRRAYRNFIKNIKKIGFYMIQESVYVKMSIDRQSVESVTKKVSNFAPKEGSIFLLTVTEKQFSQMKFIIGEYKTDYITTDDRVIVL